MRKLPITTFTNLNVSSQDSINTKASGIYAPELTQSQIDDIDPSVKRNGGMVYNTTEDSFQIYEDNDWVDINTSGGDVEGPDVSKIGNIATFADVEGIKIADSGVSIKKVPLLLSRDNLSFKAADALVDVNEISDIGHIKFTNGVGIVFVDSLMPVEFISNSYGPNPEDEQICSLFTGGLPSDTTNPSALVEIKSSTGALVLSRLTQSEADDLFTTPGMLLYNTDLKNLTIHDDTHWGTIFSGDTSGNLDLKGNRLIGLSDPVSGTDGVNLNFLSSTISDTNLTLTGAVTASGDIGAPIATSAPAKYILQTANASVPNAQILGSLTTGLVKNTTTTGIGVLSIGIAGADYYSPGNPTYFIDTSATTGNFFAGTGAGTNTTTGFQNIGIGYQALFINSVGNYNIGIGHQALVSNTTGSNNLAIGRGSLFSNISGSDNIVLGFLALSSNTTGSNNLAIGSNTLNANTTGNTNLAIGRGALLSNIAGFQNIGIGHESLNLNVGGSNNTALGSFSGSVQAAYTNCLFLGALADASANNLTNAIAIGYNASVGQSNSLVLGNGCNVGIGTSLPNAPLQFANSLANRKIVLNEVGNNDHQFVGCGYNLSAWTENEFRLQTSGTNVSFGFYTGVSSSSSLEVLRVTGSGGVGKIGIGGIYPTCPLEFAVSTQKTIALYSAAGGVHQYTGFGMDASALRYQAQATSYNHIFYAATSNTTSQEIFRIIGTGGASAAGYKIINLATPSASTDASTKGYVDTVVAAIPSSITLTGGVTGTGSTGGSIATSAPAKYILQTANASVPNAQILGSLATGLVKNTTTTGVLSIGIAGADYYSPGNPTYFIDTTGTTYNFFAGTGAGTNTTTGFQNVGVGYQALNTNTGASSCVGIGWKSLFSLSSNGNNIGVGSETLYSSVSGTANLAIGLRALYSNVNTDFNVGVGTLALFTSTGSNNTSVGHNSLLLSTTGSNNTAVGWKAGALRALYSNCLFLGYGADASVNNLTNAIAIGYNASVGQSNSLVLGNGCNVGIGTSLPNAPLQFANVEASRKIVLFDTNNNDHQFYGIGLNAFIFRYQVDSTGAAHRFYAGTSSTTSNELMCILGTGFVGIGTTTPNAPLQFASASANRKIVLNEVGNNDHQFFGFGYNSNILRYQIDSVGSGAHVFYVGTSSTTSIEVGRITGGGDFISPGTIYGRRVSGLVTMQGNASGTTVTTGGTFYKVSGTTSSSSLNQVTASTSNRITSTSATTVIADVSVYLCASHNGVATDEIQFALYKNGSLIANSVISGAVATTLVSYSLGTKISMANTDYIEVWVTHPTNGKIVTVKNMIMSFSTT